MSNHGEKFKIKDLLHKPLVSFWEIVDEILNAVLFLLIGFELLIIKISAIFLLVMLIAIVLVLCVRYITVVIPISLFKLKKKYAPYLVTILTWGGLRGGLAVALALSIPPSEQRNLILTMTYGVVAFSVIVQGITVKPLVRLAKKQEG